MKCKLLLATAFIATCSITSYADPDVGVSIRVGEPGFYGVIDIGNAPPPVVYSPRPIVVQTAPVVAPLPPLYLRVPPGHRKHWAAHCAEYHACERPVYFVDEGWYSRVYAPHYRKHEDYYQERRDYDEKRDREWNPREHHGHSDEYRKEH
jgi:hypothetical protein